MKKPYMIAAVACLAAGAFVFVSASSGVAEIQGKDRTGAPGSDNPCSQCHNGGNFAATATITVVNTETQEIVTEYIPGTTYTVAPMVSGVNNDAAGFQATAVLDDGSNAGTFANPLPGMQLEEIDGRHLIEHTQPSAFGAWAVEWTAPALGSGDVTFYMSGNAVNGNGSTSGDQYDGFDFVLPEGISDNIQVNEAPVVEAFVNADNAIVISSDEELIGAIVELYDLQGRVVDRTRLDDARMQWFPSVSTGQYLLHINKAQMQHTLRVVLR